MSVIRAICFLLLYAVIVQAIASEDVSYYEKAFSNLYLEYQSTYEKLNDQVEKCSLRSEFDYDFGSIVEKIPKGLSKNQLNAALFLLKKQHSDDCNASAVGMYISKASDLKHVIETAQKENINMESSDRFKSILAKIKETEELLFSVPASYFQMLSQYQSISKTDRQKLVSIEELRSNYNMVRLMEALQKKYSY